MANKHLAVYDLTHAPPTFDFVTWLVIAEMAKRRCGDDSLEVYIKPGPAGGFRKDKNPPGLIHRKWMLQQVVRACCPLFGASVSNIEVFTQEYHTYPYLTKTIVDNYRAGEDLPRPYPSEQSVDYVNQWYEHKFKDGRPLIVLVLREAEYWPVRNSDNKMWAKFAETIANRFNVVVMRDASKCWQDLPPEFEGFASVPWASANVDFRLALYEKAHLNMAMSGGNTTLLEFSDKAKYVIFGALIPYDSCPSPEGWWYASIGLKGEEGLPWFSEFQKHTWEEQLTFEIMKEEFWKMIAEMGG